MKINDLFPLIKYINLDSRPDRNNQAIEEFKKLNIAPERFSGITFNHKNLTKSQNGVLGCQASHIAILLEALSKKQNVLIFEDDVEFVGNYYHILSNAINELPDDWALFYLGGNILKKFFQISKYISKLTHCQSTHSYGVRWQTIPYLLTQLSFSKVIPIDMIYANIIIPNYPCYIVAPEMIAIQRNSRSDIEGAEANYNLPSRRYRENIIRLEDK